MKRFYKTAAHSQASDGWQITLDDRRVKTPKRAPLIVPSRPLADAIVAEWSAQRERIDPRSMPLTGLSNAAIDHVGADRDAFAKSIAAYAESDLVCYRAEGPDDLVALQSAVWDPLTNWARRRFDANLRITSGIAHVAQEAPALQRLAAPLGNMSDFELAAMQPLVTISGSLVIALAVAEGEIGSNDAFDAGHADELYQAGKWGDDDEARTVRMDRKSAFNAAARMLKLLRL